MLIDLWNYEKYFLNANYIIFFFRNFRYLLFFRYSFSIYCVFANYFRNISFIFIFYLTLKCIIFIFNTHLNEYQCLLAIASSLQNWTWQYLYRRENYIIVSFSRFTQYEIEITPKTTNNLTYRYISIYYTTYRELSQVIYPLITSVSVPIDLSGYVLSRNKIVRYVGFRLICIWYSWPQKCDHNDFSRYV